MRKVWIYTRKRRKGYYAGWYENGRQHAKAFPTRSLADHFAKIKYQQINSDVFLSTVNGSWDQVRS